jgi:hypothetical protein
MRCLLVCLTLLFGGAARLAPRAAACPQGQAKSGGDRVSGAAGRQIQDMLDEKESRTPAQKKIDSQLLYALKQRRGETRGVPAQPVDVGADAKGRVVVEVVASPVSARMLSRIKKLGGEVVSTSEQYHTVRAVLLLEKLERLASLPEVRFISPPARAATNGGATTN